MNKTAVALTAIICFTISMLGMGYFIQNGLINIRGNDRHVEVKGLAERDVIADIAVWELNYEVQTDDLTQGRAELAKGEKIIRDFLNAHDISNEEIKLQRLNVYQRQQERSRTGNTTEFGRVYVISQSFQASTTNVRNIEKATQDVASLIEQGIVLQPSNPRYIFTRLNDVKPEMIAEATKNAREAARRFAEDSGSNVGPILRASQGWFNILPRLGEDYGEQQAIEKKVRVITTIDFTLLN